MSITQWLKVCCVVPVTLVGCSLVIDSKLDDKARPIDAGTDGPNRFHDAGEPRMEARLCWPETSPCEPASRIFTDDMVVLEVVLFNVPLELKLPSPDRPPLAGDHFLTLTFVGAGGVEVPLDNLASKHHTFRLDQYLPLIDVAPLPGPSTLLVALQQHGGDGPTKEVLSVKVPFDLCIPGISHPGCDEGPPPELFGCKPQDDCKPCTIFDIYGVDCPLCLTRDCTTGGCITFSRIEPVLVRPGSGVDIDIIWSNLATGWSWNVGVVYGPESAPKTALLAHGVTEHGVHVVLPDMVSDNPVMLLSAIPVKPSGPQLNEQAACWPLIREDIPLPEPPMPSGP